MKINDKETRDKVRKHYEKIQPFTAKTQNEFRFTWRSGSQQALTAF